MPNGFATISPRDHPAQYQGRNVRSSLGDRPARAHISLIYHSLHESRRTVHVPANDGYDGSPLEFRYESCTQRLGHFLGGGQYGYQCGYYPKGHGCLRFDRR